MGGGVSENIALKYTWVTRWGRDGLEAGDWVMPGGKTRLNYMLSGKWGVKSTKFGCCNMPAPFTAGQTYRVLRSSLKSPAGWMPDAWIKSLFMHKKYLP